MYLKFSFWLRCRSVILTANFCINWCILFFFLQHAAIQWLDHSLKFTVWGNHSQIASTKASDCIFAKLTCLHKDSLFEVETNKTKTCPCCELYVRFLKIEASKDVGRKTPVFYLTWLFARIQPQWPRMGFRRPPHTRCLYIIFSYNFHVCVFITTLYWGHVCRDNVYLLITFTFNVFFFKVGTASLCGDLKAFLTHQNLPKGKKIPPLSHYRSGRLDSRQPPARPGLGLSWVILIIIFLKCWSCVCPASVGGDGGK